MTHSGPADQRSLLSTYQLTRLLSLILQFRLHQPALALDIPADKQLHDFQDLNTLR
jgi:hypothetical protein